MMNCITIKNPYSNMIINGNKDVENRTWKTKYRGRLYIHSAKTMYSGFEKKENYIFGAIIGYVDLVDVIAFPDNYHWILKNPVKIDPIFVNGKLSIWRMT